MKQTRQRYSMSPSYFIKYGQKLFSILLNIDNNVCINIDIDKPTEKNANFILGHLKTIYVEILFYYTIILHYIYFILENIKVTSILCEAVKFTMLWILFYDIILKTTRLNAAANTCYIIFNFNSLFKYTTKLYKV